MPLMTWTEDFSVNVKQVDEQHIKLVELLNRFHDAMKLGKGKEVMGMTFSELLDYTVYHFTTEEDFFKKYGYPHLVAHKKEHETLTKQVLELSDRFSRGEPVISAETMTFLKNWLNNHILKSDKKFGPFLNGKGVF
ncbi:MAG: Bacteriohemerythrin [Syntrophorhabdaceae bacterium PtaU1.Bin034]|jgi:hemerythrin|nr:MAG: Bacteriohemerythrin [Syntrophorhabdaceae bacterium PtaU1.Bin034]